VRHALGDVPLVATGSPYGVTPGSLVKGDGSPFRVYSPFYRAWTRHGWRGPAADRPVSYVPPGTLDSVGVPADPDLPAGVELPAAGEAAALRRWAAFRDSALTAYDGDRNRPDRPATSRMSVHLKYGLVHPRTLLADLAPRRSDSAETYTTELAWRDFYADIMFQRPDSARHPYDRAFEALPVATGAAARADFDRWCEGRTGFPIVDAGMRQLREQAWMHNRLRMITASFLVKDLHLPWWWGARHFMGLLVDGDMP